MYVQREKGIWYENRINEEWISQYPECSVFSQLKQNSEKYPELPALKFQHKTLTFREFIDTVERLAASLSAMNIKKGDIVSIISPNTPQAVIMFYAVNRIGAVANMIHPLMTESEIQYYIENTESTAVYILDAVYEKISSIKWSTEKNLKLS